MPIVGTRVLVTGIAVVVTARTHSIHVGNVTIIPAVTRGVVICAVTRRVAVGSVASVKAVGVVLRAFHSEVWDLLGESNLPAQEAVRITSDVTHSTSLTIKDRMLTIVEADQQLMSCL